jgi:ketosteroid isomerase-like protein
MTNAQLVNDYLAAFYAGDFDRAQALVASNFKFKGPFVEAASNIRLISSRSRERMPRVATADDVRSEDSC